MGDWKTVCRFFAVLIAIPLSLWTLLGCLFLRIDSADDYDSVSQSNVIVGGLFALVFILFSAPSLPGATRQRYALVAAIAILIWGGVSGALVWQLEEHMRIRSAR